MAESRHAVGVDLGGTNIRLGLVDGAGRLLAHHKRATPTHPGGMAILEAVADGVRALLLETGERALAVGMGTAGQVDWGQGSIAYCTDHLPGWDGMQVKQLLQERLGLPVWVDNDAHAALYGEYWIGAARGLQHACLLTLGTGLGGGILSNGKIFRGQRGRSGEFGHMCIVVDGEQCNCGQLGCWEMYVAGKAVRRMALEALLQDERAINQSSLHAIGRDELASQDVFAAARAGDALAAGVVDRQADYVAVGIVSLLNLFDPQAVVIGGGISTNGEFLLDKIERSLAHRLGNGHAGEQVVRLAQLGDDAGLIGAAGIAFAELGD